MADDKTKQVTTLAQSRISESDQQLNAVESSYYFQAEPVSCATGHTPDDKVSEPKNLFVKAG